MQLLALGHMMSTLNDEGGDPVELKVVVDAEGTFLARVVFVDHRGRAAPVLDSKGNRVLRAEAKTLGEALASLNMIEASAQAAAS